MPLLSAKNLDSLESSMLTKINGKNVQEQLDAYFELGETSLKFKETSKAYEYFIQAETIAEKNNEILLRDKPKCVICILRRACMWLFPP